MKKVCLTFLLDVHVLFAVAQNPLPNNSSDSSEYITYLESIIFEQNSYYNNIIDSLYQKTLPLNLNTGWNMIGYPHSNTINVAAPLHTISNQIEILKNNEGLVYIPEFSFNGIGDFTPGEGYQIKMNNTVPNFIIENPSSTPLFSYSIPGCTNPLAGNYWQLANIDNGTCLKYSDGDFIYDVNEILGCMDSIACNFNPNATDGGYCQYAPDEYTCDGDCIIDQDNDGVCDAFEIEGCLDERACNYIINPTDTITCLYPELYYNCDGLLTVSAGDTLFGGIVFYIDPTSTNGLVVSIEDQSQGISWGCQGIEIDGSSHSQIGYGAQNTIDIINNSAQTNTAAYLCDTLSLNGFNDWYLPSKDELNVIYENLHLVEIGEFESIYWSSSQQSDFFAWIQNFNAGSQNYNGKYANRKVRAIRSF